MRSLKRIVAMVLAAGMLVTSSGVTTLAAGDAAATQSEVSSNTPDVNGGESGQAVEVPEIENMGEISGTTVSATGETTEGTAGEQQENVNSNSEIMENPKAFEYVYVDEQTVNIPQEQNIAVAFADAELKLESAVLHYNRVEDGMTYDMLAANLVNNTVLFTMGYSDASEAGQYQLEGITYRVIGQEEDFYVNFSEQEVTAGYKVTTEPEQETVEESEISEIPEVTVYSMDGEGNTVEQSGDAIESAVESVLETADANGVAEAEMYAETSPKARAEERAGNKVIVICAGHDAQHPGAGGNGLREEQLTWKVANYCKQELEQYSGVTVYLDRNSVNCAYPGTATRYCLSQRVIDAAAKGASVFVDVHFNSVNGIDTPANGAEIYYPNKSYNSAIHQDGANLANNILAQLTALGLTNRGAKVKDANNEGGYRPEYDENGNIEDYFTTINLSKSLGMTGLIVEHAFLDNPGDAAKLKNESFIKQLGVADATGIAKTYGLTKGPSIFVQNKNDFTGTADIAIAGMAGSTKIKIRNEKTNTAKEYTFSTGKGTIPFKISEYGNAIGKYIVQAYDSQGKLICEESFVVKNTKNKITAVSNQETTYQLKVKFEEEIDEIQNLQFATWSDKNGQDDLIWYQARKSASGEWTATADITKHKTAGLYNVHVYATLSNGTLQFVGKTGFEVTEPGMSVKIQNYKEDQGSFDVIISDIKAPAGVSSIQVPTWQDKNQKDIIWYPAERQSDGTYKATVSMANHNYAVGKYNVHVYLYSKNGISKSVATAGQEVKLPKVSLSVEDKEKTQTHFIMKAANVGMAGNVQNVQFATWSDKNGQDDIIWYQGQKNSLGEWTATADITNHKTAGMYNVHVYATLSNGTLQFVGKTGFEVTEPSMSVKIQNYKENQGTFDVIISNVNAPAGVSSIQVPTWQDKNQRDIIWYPAEKQSDGTYKATVSMANHNYAVGKYNVHVYLYSKNGTSKGIVTAGQEVKLPKVSLSVEDKEKTQTHFIMKAANVGMAGTVQNVQFATWSDKNGQDDIIWYQGQKNSLGEWTATTDITNHKTAGMYNVHIYATLSNGTLQFVGKTGFEVTEPSMSVKIQNYKENQGTFDVIISNVNAPAGVSSIQVPTWQDKNQRDIIWYPAERQSDGTYKATVSMANHNFAVGKYNVHVYLYSKNGTSKGIATAGQEVKLPKVSLSVEDKEKTQTHFVVKAANVGMTGNVQNVQFATWSEKNGQDDLIWYQGEKNSLGEWTATADITKHKTAGTYNVHVYATLSNGTLQFVGKTSFEVSEPKATVEILNYEKYEGFDVIVKPEKILTGINNVQVPVWTAKDQSDIIWYQASKQNDGSYKVRVELHNHKQGEKMCNIHVYITMNNGIMSFVGKITQQIEEVAYYPIMGKTTVSVEQMMRYFEFGNKLYPAEVLKKGGAPTLKEFCQMYIEEAEIEGVSAEVAFAQAMKETGFLKYGGIVKIEQFNFAGLGALDGNKPGECATFPDVRTGIRAHIQHLKAYATTDPLKQTCVDPRFHLVSRGVAPYVQWLGIKENPYGKGWATAERYGYSIVNDYINVLKRL